MVDMFTILIVFLLKSYSTSAVHITPQKNLQLPTSSSYDAPVESLRLVVSLDGVYVEDKKVVALEQGNFQTNDLESTDKKFVRKLYEELDKQAQKVKEIGDKNEDVKFEGKVILQADERLNYETLQKVLYTSSLAGYGNLKLATFSYE